MPLRVAKRLTESITPRATEVTMTELPPLDISGSGWPETGAAPVTMAMCMRAWKVMNTAIPMTSSAGNDFLHFMAMRPALASRNR